MDLDFWDCFGRIKLCLITEEIRYVIFVSILVETNVNISNELNFLDDYPPSVNHIGPLPKFLWMGSFTLHATQSSLLFDKHQIHSLNKAFEAQWSVMPYPKVLKNWDT